MQKSIMKTALRATVLAALCGAGLSQAATIVVTSRDPAGVGFNDTTPVAPVGGNTGTTLGQQRWNVYQYVAHIWEQAIQSDVTIQVNAGWEALTCDSGSAVLGSASPWNLWHDFPGGKPGTWYPQALANKLSGTNLSVGQADDGSGYGNVDIKTQFNINLGGTGCLDGIPFYLGLDGKAGSKVNFMTTLLHELGHGLGFTVLAVNSSTGLRISADGNSWAADGLPSVWEQFMYDNNMGKTWLNMNYIERRVSAVSPLALAWTGPQAVAGAAMLSSTPSIKLATSAPGYAGYYAYNTAAFGAAVSTGLNLGTLATMAADTTGAGQGCTTFSAADAAAVAGKVAIIDRGICGFAVKAKNAQNAGAIGVIIANNAAGAAPGLGGTDGTVVIPTISVSQTDGAKLKAAVTASAPYGGRGKVGIATASLGIDDSKKAGADAAGRPLLYTPATLAPGSSVSHWDVSASPNLLMEPNINADLTNNLIPPYDLTLPLLKDIGW